MKREWTSATSVEFSDSNFCWRWIAAFRLRWGWGWMCCNRLMDMKMKMVELLRRDDDCQVRCGGKKARSSPSAYRLPLTRYWLVRSASKKRRRKTAKHVISLLLLWKGCMAFHPYIQSIISRQIRQLQSPTFHSANQFTSMINLSAEINAPQTRRNSLWTHGRTNHSLSNSTRKRRTRRFHGACQEQRPSVAHETAKIEKNRKRPLWALLYRKSWRLLRILIPNSPGSLPSPSSSHRTIKTKTKHKKKSNKIKE